MDKDKTMVNWESKETVNNLTHSQPEWVQAIRCINSRNGLYIPHVHRKKI